MPSSCERMPRRVADSLGDSCIVTTWQKDDKPLEIGIRRLLPFINTVAGRHPDAILG